MNRFSAMLKAFQNPSLVTPAKTYTGSSFAGLMYNNITLTNNLTFDRYGASMSYLYVPAVYTSVNIISEALATLPYTVTRNGKVVADREHPEGSRLLHAIENSYQYWHIDLLDLCAKALLIWGKFYIQKVPNLFGYSAGLRWLNPNAVMMQVLLGEIEGYWYFGQVSETFKPHEIAYQHLFNPNDDLGINGLSPVMTVLAKANTELDFDAFIKAYHDNAGIPGLLLTPDKSVRLDDQDLTRLRDLLKNRFQGVRNFFRTLLIPFAMTAETFETPDLSKTVAGADRAERIIYDTFHIPDKLLGRDGAYQFDIETRNAFMNIAVKPYCIPFERLFNEDLLPAFDGDGYRFQFDFSAFETVDVQEERKQTVTLNDYRAGLLTYNEARAKRGYAETLPPEKDFYLADASQTRIPVSEWGGNSSVGTPAPAMPELPGESLDTPLGYKRLDFTDAIQLASRYNIPLDVLEAKYQEFCSL